MGEERTGVDDERKRGLGGLNRVGGQLKDIVSVSFKSLGEKGGEELLLRRGNLE